MTFTIRLPWPPACISPNAKRKKHWREYAPATKSARNTAWGLTLEVTGASPSGLPQPLPMTWTICPPDRQHRDRSNMIGHMKAFEDGISDALGMDDRHFRPSYEFGEPVKGGCVTVEIHAEKASG